jgi:hypothetical protein
MTLPETNFDARSLSSLLPQGVASLQSGLLTVDEPTVRTQTAKYLLQRICLDD